MIEVEKIKYIKLFIIKSCPLKFSLFLILIFLSGITSNSFSQGKALQMNYTISFPNPENHGYTVALNCKNWKQDTIVLKMPEWMPGYYQLMSYAKTVNSFQVLDDNKKTVAFKKINGNSWMITGIKNKSFFVKYTIQTDKQFVANSYVDKEHAYLIPGNTFLYIDKFLKTPVTVKLQIADKWKKTATGLNEVAGSNNLFTAPDFDILYDCPILVGDLQELPAFKVKGINHRFLGYRLESFDHQLFMNNLKKVVEAAVNIIGDIPYNEYTFIGIGPGRGGIEHLNNTTVSFDGKGLDNAKGMNQVMNFLAHEYFHHYNVKRIRPFELGPFDYDKGSKTNLLWVSEGLSVYYEYLIVKRAGIVGETTLLSNLDGNLNAVENNSGKMFQSLQQASYNSWNDGPFGTSGNEPGKTISYYDKGPLVGLLLDFEIRNATENKKSLDDVMRLLYWKYYKEKDRGFTEAEFQAASEEVAGITLKNIFEYVYTTKELDYEKYLAYGGLKLQKEVSSTDGKPNIQKLKIIRIENPNALQTTILNAWLGN